MMSAVCVVSQTCSDSLDSITPSQDDSPTPLMNQQQRWN